jgi:hypothetical protein
MRSVSAALIAICLLAASPSCKPKGSPELREALRHLASTKSTDRAKGFHDLADLLNQKRLTEKDVRPLGKELLTAYNTRHDRLAPMQRSAPQVCGSWVEATTYQELRLETEVLLDALGYLDTEEGERALRRGLALMDARLKYFAASALLRRNKSVDDASLHAIAADEEHRARLFGTLAERGETHRLPVAVRTQEALARSEMVRWLTYPTELGCVPTEIELMKRVRDGDDDWFVFRFRSDEKWLAGIAGPFTVANEPTATANGGTFSDFQVADSATAEGHAERIQGVMDRARAKSK